MKIAKAAILVAGLLGLAVVNCSGAELSLPEKAKPKRLTPKERRELLVQVQKREVSNADILKRATNAVPVRVVSAKKRAAERVKVLK